MTPPSAKVTAHKDPALPAPRALPAGRDWVAVLKHLTPDMGETLVIVVRTLYPHDRLPDRIYRRVVAAFDRLAAESPAVQAMIAAVLAALDGDLPFAELSESYRVATLKRIEAAGGEATAGFVFLQRAAVRFLYDDIEVWSAFGYEGASTHLGGYVDRGFDDLDWLSPLPPEFARATGQ